MKKIVTITFVALIANYFILPACDKKARRIPVDTLEMTEVARSDYLWTGIAVSGEGRIFVNYPRWSADIPFSVGELGKDGEVKPYPDKEWNDWNPPKKTEDNFICVQSVYVDNHDFLWILDTGLNIYQGGIAEGGPKLIKIDLATNRVIRNFSFNTDLAPPYSYLNDIRVDTKLGFAYITDSGLGALIVVDLKTGQSRRLLTNHPAFKTEDIVLTIEGTEWLQPDGSRPQIHSDGIALTPDGSYLYFQALTSRTLYRIKTKYLRNTSLSASQLGKKIEFMGKTGAADGIACGSDGCVYLTSLEYNAIRRFTPEGKVEMVFQDPELKWPDSIDITNQNEIYITTSQLHLRPNRTEPYKIFKLQSMDNND